MSAAGWSRMDDVRQQRYRVLAIHHGASAQIGIIAAFIAPSANEASCRRLRTMICRNPCRQRTTHSSKMTEMKTQKEWLSARAEVLVKEVAFLASRDRPQAPFPGRVAIQPNQIMPMSRTSLLRMCPATVPNDMRTLQVQPNRVAVVAPVAIGFAMPNMSAALPVHAFNATSMPMAMMMPTMPPKRPRDEAAANVSIVPVKSIRTTSTASVDTAIADMPDVSDSSSADGSSSEESYDWKSRLQRYDCKAQTNPQDASRTGLTVVPKAAGSMSLDDDEARATAEAAVSLLHLSPGASRMTCSPFPSRTVSIDTDQQDLSCASLRDTPIMAPPGAVSFSRPLAAWDVSRG